MNLLTQIKKLQKTKVKQLVNKRLADFDKLGSKGNNEWFSELCFCILTANSRASSAINIQKEIGTKGFQTLSQSQIVDVIKSNNHRFHNNKARFIVGARPYSKIKSILKKESDPRVWLVRNIKGLGWKESSHFLRNVGFIDYAILDRHIINLLIETNYLKEKPKTLAGKTYLDIENTFKQLAVKLKMSCSELDLYMWWMKTGTVLK